LTVEEFRDVVALWHVNEARDTDVVLAACDLVVAGVDGPAVSMLAGEMSPRELAEWVHQHFSHDLPEAEELAALRDIYETLEYYAELSAADVDEQVMAEVRRITS